MLNLFIRESYINVDNNSRYGDSDWYESSCISTSELYRTLVKDFGRCVSKVYIDKDGKSIQVGWIFQKRCKYDDCKDTFIREVWIDVSTVKPEKKLVTTIYPETPFKG